LAPKLAGKANVKTTNNQLEKIMKRTTPFTWRLHSSSLTGLILVGLWSGGLQAHTKSEPFTRILIFGDSLTDTGNFYRLSGGYPPPPYFEGRFCNGPLWVEYLAAELGMQYEPADNFAVAGATTGTSNSNDGPGRQFPGLLDEIASFINDGGVTEPERALYVVAAGANDFSVGLAAGASPQTIIENGVNNTLAGVQRLRESGARFIIVMNVPDLGVTPLALNSGNGALLTQLSKAYNQVLGIALDRLAQAGIPTMRLDAFAVLDKMVQDPAAYGFSNVSVPFLLAPPGTSPDGFLFWDPFHPTTKAHEVLAEEAMNQLMNTFSPGNGRGNPEASSRGLHGLVNAALHRP
jgi:phospholipase/lecithinase/hemolysin